MGRKASPRVWREWYVTEAGGQGIHKLCPVTAGFKHAQEQLEQYLEGLRKEREAGVIHSDGPYTVAQLAAEFLEWKETTRKEGTADFHHKNLKRFVKWYGNVHVRKLLPTHGIDYLARLKKENLGNVTINHHLRSAQAVLNFGVDTDRLIKNPWRKKLPLLPEPHRKRVVTDEEFEKLLKACDENCIAYRGIITAEANAQLMKDILCTLRFTALRPGELRPLKWHHINWDEGIIEIPAVEQKTGTMARNPEDRIVPILEEAKAILLARKERNGDNPYVFPSVMGTEWTDVAISKRVARIRKWAGLDEPDHNGEKIVPYSLRYTRLTEAGTEEDWPTYTLMKYAGHTSPTMTKRYVHPSKDELLRAARVGEKRRRASQE